MQDIVLVGCGNWGKNILRDLLKLGCRVRVVDTDPSACSRALLQGAFQVSNQMEDWPNISGFVVAVPIPSLAPVAASLLVYKKPIFVEKTLLRSMEDYRLLKNTPGSEEVFAMHKWHYHPGIEALRQIGISGILGEISELVTTRQGWVNDFHGGDVFWTQAVHDITIIKHILGGIPKHIDTIHVIRDTNGLPVSIRATLGKAPKVFIAVSGRHTSKASGVSLHGPLGSAELKDSLDDHILIETAKGAKKHPIPTEYPLFLELKEFLEYLQGGPRPRCDLESAREITEALLSLRKAAGISET